MGDFVQVNVSNSQNDVVSFEKKFPRDIAIAELKVSSVHEKTFVPVTIFKMWNCVTHRWLLIDLAKLGHHEITLIEF